MMVVSDDREALLNDGDECDSFEVADGDTGR